MKVFSVSEMVAAEKAADAAGWPYAEMMETAGRLSAEIVQQRYPIANSRVLILVGPGNNGGDGLVAGRYLAEAGADVAFYLFKPRNPDTDDNYAKIQEMGLFAVDASFDQRYRVLRTRLRSTDILIDALLGTGVSRPIEGELAQLMKQVAAGLAEREETLSAEIHSPLTSIATLPERPAQPRVPVVAIDCPSGLNCDTGELDPLAISAEITVTFAGPKRGHFIFPGAAAVGDLIVADIQIDPHLPAVADVVLTVTTAETTAALLPPRPIDGHKGTFGTALIAAGSANYFGAPLLAGRGAYRAGAGLVALAVPKAVRATVAQDLPEATYPAVSAEIDLDAAAVDELEKSLARADAMLVGPGLGDAHAFLAALLAQDSLPPMVVDADGLNLLAASAELFEQLPSGSILTPHPGEMARLTGMALAELKEQDRVTLAQAKAAEWGQIVVLKGAYTVVAAPDGATTLLPFANPVLGVAGSGDVLAGVIVGLLAQGLSPYDAAVAGGSLHGLAGQLALEKWGTAGVVSAEIADLVPNVMRHLRGI